MLKKCDQQVQNRLALQVVLKSEEEQIKNFKNFKKWGGAFGDINTKWPKITPLRWNYFFWYSLKYDPTWFFSSQEKRMRWHSNYITFSLDTPSEKLWDTIAWLSLEKIITLSDMTLESESILYKNVEL